MNGTGVISQRDMLRLVAATPPDCLSGPGQREAAGDDGGTPVPARGHGAYQFDAFRLDLTRGILLGPDGAELHLRPKSFALLRHLLDNPGRLLSRDELLDTLWPGVIVTDGSLTQCIGALRQAFGDRAAYVLQTVPKRGYTLIAPVERHGSAGSEQAAAVAPGPVPVRRQDAAPLRRELLMVHRFEAPDGDQACVLLADAITTDLVAVLTSLEGLRLVPATDAAGSEGFRLRGEVRAVRGGLRVTVRLEDAPTGAALWAERLEQGREDPPELPAASLTTLVIHLGQQVDQHTLAAARRKPLDRLTARELHLVGRDHHQRGTEADTLLAKEMFARAIETDPDYPLAYAWQAYTVHRVVTHGWGTPGEQAARDEALRLARRAVQLDPTAPLCLSRLAFALMLHQRWDEAVHTARMALDSDRPAFTSARNTCCEVLAHAGFPEEAEAVARGTVVLDRLCPPSTHALLGRALLLAGRPEEALPPLRLCASRLPDYAPAYDSLVVAAMESGRLPEALAARRELSRLRPGWTGQNHSGLWYFRRPGDADRFHAAHRRAAVRAGAAAAPAEPAASQSEPAQDGAALRQEAVAVHDLRAAHDDPAALRAASALTADLMTELVRSESLRVVAGVGQGRAGGFALKGDVHSMGEHLRASLRLEDLTTGTTFWAGRLDWPGRQPAAFPAERIAALAVAMDTEIGRTCLRRARQKPVDALSARELILLGKEHYDRGTEAGTALAQEMLARAMAADPGYALAHASQAFAVARAAVHAWAGPGRRDLVEQAVQLARRAVDLEPDSPMSLATLAHCLALQDHWDEAVALARRALRTTRMSDDAVRAAAGYVLAAGGHPGEGEGALRHAVEQNPHCSPVVHFVLGQALLLDRRPAEAVGELRRCLAQLPDYALGHRSMVVAATEAGLAAGAREALRHIHRLRPDWTQGDTPVFWFLRRPDDRTRFRTALDAALRAEAAATANGLCLSRPGNG